MVGEKKTNFGNLARERHKCIWIGIYVPCTIFFLLEWVNEGTVLPVVKAFKLEVGCFCSQGKPRDVEEEINCYSSGRETKKKCMGIRFSIDGKKKHTYVICICIYKSSGEINTIIFH